MPVSTFNLNILSSLNLNLSINSKLKVRGGGLPGGVSLFRKTRVDAIPSPPTRSFFSRFFSLLRSSSLPPFFFHSFFTILEIVPKSLSIRKIESQEMRYRYFARVREVSGGCPFRIARAERPMDLLRYRVRLWAEGFFWSRRVECFLGR